MFQQPWMTPIQTTLLLMYTVGDSEAPYQLPRQVTCVPRQTTTTDSRRLKRRIIHSQTQLLTENVKDNIVQANGSEAGRTVPRQVRAGNQCDQHHSQKSGRSPRQTINKKAPKGLACVEPCAGVGQNCRWGQRMTDLVRLSRNGTFDGC
jgi:hypothetical protein